MDACRILAGMIKLCATCVLLLLVTACASSSNGAGTAANTPVSSSAQAIQSAIPKPTHPTNADVCVKIQNYLAGPIKKTFKHWGVANDLFDQRIAKALRREATHLYRLSAEANGAVTNAVQHEAGALVNISIAIEQQNANAVGNASNRGNSAIAEVRGVCNF